MSMFIKEIDLNGISISSGVNIFGLIRGNIISARGNEKRRLSAFLIKTMIFNNYNYEKKKSQLVMSVRHCQVT